jgi:chaperonin GroES
MNDKCPHLIPLLDRVIIEPIAGPEKIGAIFVPDQAREKPDTGRVLARGPGRVSEHGTRIPMSVEVGDQVVFNRYSASQIRVAGRDLCLVHESDINCIVKTPSTLNPQPSTK